jgi:hypothetical protein
MAVQGGRMSYFEEMGSTIQPCPCGKGKITTTRFMDDWNRTREETKMDCSVCNKKYVFDACEVNEKGQWFQTGNWIKVEDAKKADALVKEAGKMIEKANALAISRYLKLWLNTFADIKSKKEIWSKLISNGKRYPSLSTFYNGVRSSGVERYLESHFKGPINPYDAIDFDDKMKILGKKDIEISGLFSGAGQKLKEADKIRGRVGVTR